MSNVETGYFAQDVFLFVRVVDAKSFTKAASDLGITKSAVSKRIRRLEAHLELQLLHRSTRQLSLTDAGRRLYQGVDPIRSDLMDLKQCLIQNQDQVTGVVRIHAPVSFGKKYLIPLMQDFMQRYPGVELQLHLGGFYEDLIGSGMDLSIHVGPIPDSGLYVRHLFSSKMVVCASPSYLEQHGYLQVPLDLFHHNCLRYISISKKSNWLFKVDGKYESIEVSGHLSVGDANTLEEAAILGQGMVMLPEYVVASSLKSGKLVRVLSEYCSSSVDVSILYSDREFLAPQARLWMEYIQDHRF